MELAKSIFKNTRSRDRALRLGMQLFLLSLAMLFAAGLFGYAVVRVQLDIQWPADLPPLPRILWLSTLVLAASSASMQAAVIAARRDESSKLKPMMAATFLLALLFLIAQAVAWNGWYEAVQARWIDSEPHRWALTSFFVMTGVHAAHVIGGLAPMVVVTGRAFAGAYAGGRAPGVELCAMYWHFLGGVWVVLFLALLIGT